jgi:copper oxidase (laccase) domain-containing protein
VSVEAIRAAALECVPHGFLGRRGGVSTGELAGLNVGAGSSDDRDAIAENRRRAVAAVLPNAQLATVHQVHSAEAVVVEQPWPHEQRPRADAMVSDRPGLLLGILTADCAPVLFADAGAGVIGDRFLDAVRDNARFFAAGASGRPNFDLPGYVRHRLLIAEIGEVETLQLDTYADEDRFYSYRRSTHRSQADYGRQFSLIGLSA